MVKTYTMVDVQELPMVPLMRHGVIEKLMKVPNFLTEYESLRSGEIDKMFDPANHFYLVGEAGLIGFLQIVEGHSAECTATFWDQHLRGKEVVLVALIEEVMEKYSLGYMFCKIDRKRQTLIAFAERVGFTLHETEPDWVYMRIER